MLDDAVPLQRPMEIPEARGPVSAAVIDALRGRGSDRPLADVVRDGVAASADVIATQKPATTDVR